MSSENLQNGEYKTSNGSIVNISGKHSGIVKVTFDWFEENACIDCVPELYPKNFGKNDWRLVWHCDVCGGGNAKLELIR